MIRREDVQLIIFEGRGANKHLLRWSKSFPHRWRARPPTRVRDYVALWRNQQVREFLARTTLGWVWLIDDDMVPVPDTSLLLESESDVACCRCWSRTGTEAHPAEAEVSAACLLVSRHALEAVGPPWFQVVLSADGTGLAKCECTYFAERMRAAGFTPAKLGRVGHIVPLVVLPGQGREDPFLVKFPKDL